MIIKSQFHNCFFIQYIFPIKYDIIPKLYLSKIFCQYLFIFDSNHKSITSLDTCRKTISMRDRHKILDPCRERITIFDKIFSCFFIVVKDSQHCTSLQEFIHNCERSRLSEIISPWLECKSDDRYRLPMKILSICSIYFLEKILHLLGVDSIYLFDNRSFQSIVSKLVDE